MHPDKLGDINYDFYRPTASSAASALVSHMDKINAARKVQAELTKQALADGAFAAIKSAGDGVLEGFIFKQTPPAQYRPVKNLNYANLYTVDGIEKASYPLLKLEGLPSFRIHESAGLRHIAFPVVFESANRLYLAIPKSSGQQPPVGFERVLRDDLLFAAQMATAKRDTKLGGQRRPG